jgi:hypothetical protein
MLIDTRRGEDENEAARLEEDFMQRPRTPSKLAESLHRRLNAYALVASAAGIGVLALGLPAEAKIVYTPAHVPIVENGGPVKLDLNHDGITDFTFSNFCGCSAHMPAILEIFTRQSLNGVWESQSRFGSLPAALKAGVRVGSNKAFKPADSQYMALAFPTGTSGGFWAGSHRAYLGLKFQINGKTHYGWARLTVKTDAEIPPVIKATLTGYAYETTPNKPIITGKTKGPDVITVEPASLGHLAQGASAISQWRKAGGN